MFTRFFELGGAFNILYGNLHTLRFCLAIQKRRLLVNDITLDQKAVLMVNCGALMESISIHVYHRKHAFYLVVEVYVCGLLCHLLKLAHRYLHHLGLLY